MMHELENQYRTVINWRVAVLPPNGKPFPGKSQEISLNHLQFYCGKEMAPGINYKVIMEVPMARGRPPMYIELGGQAEFSVLLGLQAIYRTTFKIVDIKPSDREFLQKQLHL